jgi:tRNA A-37 threonylcarbamoyl transferase component Bud32
VTAPDHIGQYRILRKIGAGGMGMVFVGEHVLIERRAAIKTLQPLLSKQPEIVERFFNEARATSAISDPGIVQIFDFGYHVDGTAYIVMELLEGEGLADRLERLGSLPIASALRIARQVASSLAAAHAKQIVHRDLKPENIFLIRDGEAQGGERTKLLDFGICAVGGAPETTAPPETLIGTPVYMSPEQCRGGGQGDPRSDVYGLGCVLFHMLTGRAPFERDSIRDLMMAHLVEAPPPVTALRADVPPLVQELVLRCLAKSPEDRFSTMAELGAEIERALARLSAPEPPASEVPPAMPLAIGFRSAFDASLAAHGAGSAEPAASRSLAITMHLRGGALRRAVLGIALLGGALLASFATRLTEADDEPVAAPAAAAPAPPVSAAVTAGAAISSRAAAPSPEPGKVPEIPGVAAPPPVIEPALAPRRRAGGARAIADPPPSRPAPAVRPAPQAPAASEDLYELR